MPARRRVPAYKLHKPSGQARVILDGRHVYLGPHGCAESREKYARLIAEQFRPGGGDEAVSSTAIAGRNYPDLSINEMLLRYTDFAERYYVKDGKPTHEVDNLKYAMGSLRTLYSHTLARDFGPRALKSLQQYMVENDDLARKVINGRINRIRRIFKWAVSEELVPPTVLEALRAVPGLRLGRCSARETEPIRPVPDDWVEATLRFLPPQVADMVRLQRLTGMRPGDVVLMRPCDIDRTGDLWVYEPAEHKTLYLGRRRQIPLGPKAKAIVAEYLNTCDPGGYFFSPAEVMEWRREQKRQNSTRTTKRFPSEVRRLARDKAARRRRQSRRKPGVRYDARAYYSAIMYGLSTAKKAGLEIPHWHPNQLRHSRGTEVRRRHGLEGAQVVLGHARANITEVYAERDLLLAKKIAKKTG